MLRMLKPCQDSALLLLQDVERGTSLAVLKGPMGVSGDFYSTRQVHASVLGSQEYTWCCLGPLVLADVLVVLADVLVVLRGAASNGDAQGPCGTRDRTRVAACGSYTSEPSCYLSCPSAFD